MIHIEGANTAAEMWSQLRLVKEARGKLDILSLHHRLYRTVANESTDITEHTTEMCHVQEELGILGSTVTRRRKEDALTIPYEGICTCCNSRAVKCC